MVCTLARDRRADDQEFEQTKGTERIFSEFALVIRLRWPEYHDVRSSPGGVARPIETADVRGQIQQSGDISWSFWVRHGRPHDIGKAGRSHFSVGSLPIRIRSPRSESVIIPSVPFFGN